MIKVIKKAVDDALRARDCRDDELRGFAVRMVMDALDILPTLDDQVTYGVAIYQAGLWGKKVDEENKKLQQQQWKR